MAQPQDALCLTLLHQQAPESALPQGCAARPALAQANASSFGCSSSQLDCVLLFALPQQRAARTALA